MFKLIMGSDICVYPGECDVRLILWDSENVDESDRFSFECTSALWFILQVSFSFSVYKPTLNSLEVIETWSSIFGYYASQGSYHVLLCNLWPYQGGGNLFSVSFNLISTCTYYVKIVIQEKILIAK